MTPLQFAQKFCANYQSNGSCLGAWIADDGSIPFCKPKPKCVLPARCRYFEECVVPNAERLPDPLAKSAQEAVWKYRLGLPEVINSMKIRKLRRCQCGALLDPRKRYCPVCRRARRRASMSRKITKSQNPTVSVFPALNGQGLTEGTLPVRYDHSRHPQNPS